MKDYIVESLDNPQKRLMIFSIGGSAPMDIGIDTGWFTGVYLLSPIGAGNSRYKSPVYNSCLDIMWLFNRNEESLLQTKEIKPDDMDFSFAQEDIITFATSDNIPEIANKRLDFIKSKSGFFGLHTGRRFDFEPAVLAEEDIVWLSGPDNKEFAQNFGCKAYAKRREIFGTWYDLAASNPPQMQNPIYPMAQGSNYIIKQGNKPC